MDRFLLKRLLIVLALLLIGWVVFVSWQQIKRHQRIQDEVAALEAEAEKIRQENETFSERISYFSSDAFREQEAKKKLGLKKTNEAVVVIKPTLAASGPQPAPAADRGEAPAYQTETANYEKWWELFSR